jgi:hypothetical protein
MKEIATHIKQHENGEVNLADQKSAIVGFFAYFFIL